MAPNNACKPKPLRGSAWFLALGVLEACRGLLYGLPRQKR